MNHLTRVLIFCTSLVMFATCTSGTDSDKLAELERQIAELKTNSSVNATEPTAQSNPSSSQQANSTSVVATPTATSTSVVATPTATAVSTSTPEIKKGAAINTVYYVSDTGGDGVKPRSTCENSSPRAFESSVPEGLQVQGLLAGFGDCVGWYKVSMIATSDTGKAFWIKAEYLSLQSPNLKKNESNKSVVKPVATPAPKPVATPAPKPVATPAPKPVATPTPAVTCNWADSVEKVVASTVKITHRTESGGTSWGTAFYIGNGYFVTAQHVVDGASRFYLDNHIITEHMAVTATAVKANATTDVALVQTSDPAINRLIPLKWAATSKVYSGQDVKAAGYPDSVEAESSVTSGSISKILKESDGTYLRTDTPVNPGNSGGPLFDECGDVLGIVTSKLVGIPIEGVSFATSEQTANAQFDSLRPGQGVKIQAAIPATPHLTWRKPSITDVCNEHYRYGEGLDCSDASDYKVNAGERTYFEITHKYTTGGYDTKDTWNWRDIQYEFNGSDKNIYSGLELAAVIAKQPLGSYTVKVRFRKYTADTLLDDGWFLWSDPFSFTVVNRLPSRPHAAYICVDSCSGDGDWVPYLGTYGGWYSIRRNSGEQYNALDFVGYGVFPYTSQTSSFLEWRFEPVLAEYLGGTLSKAYCYPNEAVFALMGEGWFKNNCVEPFDLSILTNGYWEFRGRIHNKVGAGPWSFPIKFYLKDN